MEKKEKEERIIVNFNFMLQLIDKYKFPAPDAIALAPRPGLFFSVKVIVSRMSSPVRTGAYEKGSSTNTLPT